VLGRRKAGCRQWQIVITYTPKSEPFHKKNLHLNMAFVTKYCFLNRTLFDLFPGASINTVEVGNRDDKSGGKPIEKERNQWRTLQ